LILQRSIGALDHHIESTNLIYVPQLETVNLSHFSADVTEARQEHGPQKVNEQSTARK
jgi:hypothetical protein